MWKNDSPYGCQRQLNFSKVFDSFERFKDYFNTICIDKFKYPSTYKMDNIETLYYLLYGTYGASTFNGSDIYQAIFKLFSIVFMYGPSWEKELDIQNKLRSLTDEELECGSTAIYNQASTNGGAPTTQSTIELLGIDNQNVTKYKKDKVNKYMDLENLLKRDVTKTFIDRFKVLFKTITAPISDLWYYDIEEEGEGEISTADLVYQFMIGGLKGE